MSWMNLSRFIQTNFSGLAARALTMMRSLMVLLPSLTGVFGLTMVSAVSAAADVPTPNKVAPPATPSMELLDIELPSSPDFDWWPWISFGLGVILLLALIVLLVWLRNRFWTTFRLQIQLKRKLEALPNISDVELPTQAMLIYQTFSQSQGLLTESHQQALSQQLNQLCFSQQKASRETLQAALESFRLALVDSLKQRPSLWHLVLIRMRNDVERLKQSMKNGAPDA